MTELDALIARLRKCPARMLGTTDEDTFLACHEAAAALEGFAKMIREPAGWILEIDGYPPVPTLIKAVAARHWDPLASTRVVPLYRKGE
jgi:hypothetical protein